MQAEPQENNSEQTKQNGADSPLPEGIQKPGLLLKVLTGILIVMTPVGFVIMFTDFGRAYLWTTTIFLGLEALLLFVLLVKIADLLSVVLTTAIIFMASWFVEYWGVKTGMPFGIYSYSHVLFPQIGGVPLAIMFAWFSVSVSSLLSARYFLKGKNEVSAVIVASAFILATDILLEPFASFVNRFWVWQSDLIPVQNFISWFVIGLLFTVTISQLIKWDNIKNYSSMFGIIPALILAVNIVNFSLVNFYNGYFILSLTGLLIFAVLTFSALYFSKDKKGAV